MESEISLADQSLSIEEVPKFTRTYKKRIFKTGQENRYHLVARQGANAIFDSADSYEEVETK